jgi:hypothetical protein
MNLGYAWLGGALVLLGFILGFWMHWYSDR